ncbi:hypothetical protein EUTSA_v10023139mg [Eutrema salsugineum]|uniref:F-box domain-containing protein n=1 Tax=Eutrema salsugineum TaxID=72664 RepID=V4MEU7_EUTSA|nr:hypothetical protein EUTSA_v10023139mg [Eutrema salsugineum]
MATERLSSCGSVDSISSFPDEILAPILSSLPTKQAASISILSKRWRNLFQLMNLLCASFYFDDSVLLHPEREDNALERGVSDLDLRVRMTYFNKKPPTLDLPETIYINNTLVKLTLGTELCLGRAPYDVDLPLVKSLFLDTVWFTDFDLGELIQGCPKLEELCIHHEHIPDEELGFDTIQPQEYIEHLNVKKVTIRYNDHFTFNRHLILNAPRLIYLDYSDYLTCNDINWGYFKSTSVFNDLLEARLNIASSPNGRFSNEHKICSELLNFICNICIISLYLFPFSFLCSFPVLINDRPFVVCGVDVLQNLATLNFESKNRKEYWELLSIMIEKSPKLETLVLKGLCGIGNLEVVNIGGNVVKVVEIQDYEGRLEEFNHVKCFLWEMENLEKMSVKISDKIEKKLQVTNVLLALPKRSSKLNKRGDVLGLLVQLSPPLVAGLLSNGPRCQARPISAKAIVNWGQLGRSRSLTGPDRGAERTTNSMPPPPVR